MSPMYWRGACAREANVGASNAPPIHRLNARRLGLESMVSPRCAAGESAVAGQMNILAFWRLPQENRMTEAYVYDAIRTPRGKGKKDGSLHEVKPVNLLAGVLAELQRR